MALKRLAKRNKIERLLTLSPSRTARVVISDILGPLILTIAAAGIFLAASEPFRHNTQASDNVIGCDPFGYIRGADLFRDNGFVAGFDTAIRAPEVPFLIDVGKATGHPVGDWSNAIAPLCHHLDIYSGKVILQYPPGTALLMSWLPKGREAMSLVVAMGAVLAATLSLILNTGAPVAPRALLAILVVGTVQLLTSQTMHASFSVPWTITFIPVLALICVNFCRASGRWQIMLGLLLGILSAVLIQVRLPNIFIIAGIAVYIATEGRLWRSEARRRHGLAALIGLISFVILGPILLGTYNAVNAGGPFHSTYTGGDVEALTLSEDVFFDNLNFYYNNWDFAVISRLSGLVVLLFVLQVMRSNKHATQIVSAAFCVVFVFVTSAAFFAFHSVTAVYYLLPSDLFVLYFFAIILCDVDRPDQAPRWLRWAAVGGMVALVASQLPTSPVGPSFSANIPEEVLRPNSIVWAAVTSGSLLNYNNKYAAKLIAAEECTQQRFISIVTERKMTQYFIDDSIGMHALIDAVGKHGNLSKIGTYDLYIPFDVYRLDAIDLPANCIAWIAPTVSDF